MIYAVNKRTKEHYEVPCVGYMRSGDWHYVIPDPDGWVEWHEGSGNPLPDQHPCDVKIFGKRIVPNVIAYENPEWEGVTHYRPILEAREPEPPAWDGEGLPPVGSRCMKGHAEVLVIAHVNVGSLYDPAVVYQPINHPMGIDWKVSNVFSPIRSEEDCAVGEIRRIACSVGADDQWDFALALYRAGYRKKGGEG